MKKTSFKPVGYFAVDPVKKYSFLYQKINLKLKTGKEKIKKLVKNSSGLSGEIYLVERDGGQKRLINKSSRQTVLDEFELREIKKAVELQIKEVEQSKLKEWAVYR